MPHSHLGCQSPRDYFLEQLLTILVCAGLGVVGILMYQQDMLRHILAPAFHMPVLIGSIAVLVLVAVRALSVWREAGELQPVDDTMSCQQNHMHTAACNHLPGLPGGSPDATDPVIDHGHSHDMSWLFVRMLILVFPIGLFALGIPSSGFSQERLNKMLGKQTALNLDPKELERLANEPTTTEYQPAQVDPDGVRVRILLTKDNLKIREELPPGGYARYVLVPDAGVEMRFNELTDAAYDADKRRSYTGQTAILTGKFNRVTDKEFTLYRLKMTCCGPDAVMMQVRIVAPQVPPCNDGEWVRVRGVIRYMKLPGEDRYIPVIVLADINDIQRNIQVANEYEF